MALLVYQHIFSLKINLESDDMPKIAEIKEIDGDVWVRIGKPGEFESGIAIYTPEEYKSERRSSYNFGYDMAKAGEPKDIYYE